MSTFSLFDAYDVLLDVVGYVVYKLFTWSNMRVIFLALVLLGLSPALAIAYEPEINGGPSKTVGTGTRFVERGSSRFEFHRGSGR